MTGSAQPRAPSPVDVTLRHRTCYRYDREVTLWPHVIRLRPAPRCRSCISDYSLAIGPAAHQIRWHEDVYGNCVAGATFHERARELRIEVELTVQLRARNPFDFLLAGEAALMPFAYRDDERRALTAYLETEDAGPQLAAWLSHLRARLPLPTVEFLVESNAELARDIRYEKRLESGVHACEQTLAEASGSCRDSTWLLVQTLRHFGVAARFVSGYLIQLANGYGSTRSEDTADFHAWCEAYLPGAGWIGLDPTSGLLTAEGHIPLASAVRPDATAPVTGHTEPSGCELSYDMAVSRIGTEQ